MYILTKSALALMIGFIISTIMGYFLIPLLKKLNAGQRISVFVGESHKKKNGIPTIGGLIFEKNKNNFSNYHTLSRSLLL